MSHCLGLRKSWDWVEAGEEVIDGGLEEHLPDHVWDALDHDVFAEQLFEDGEDCLGHLSPAISLELRPSFVDKV